jgi:hypothetical protein
VHRNRALIFIIALVVLGGALQIYRYTAYLPMEVVKDQVKAPIVSFVTERGIRPVWRAAGEGSGYYLGVYSVGKSIHFVWYFPPWSDGSTATQPLKGQYVESITRADAFVGCPVSSPPNVPSGAGWSAVVMDPRIERVKVVGESGQVAWCLPRNKLVWAWLNGETRIKWVEAQDKDGHFLYGAGEPQ